jgi:hypothetical protein
VRQLVSGSITTSWRIRVQQLSKTARRHASWVGVSLCVASLAAACTLTQDDFDPKEVSALESMPEQGSSGAGVQQVTGEVSSCTSATGCCASASDCADGQACVNGQCSTTCTGAEDVSACELLLCPGPGCLSESASCSDGIMNGREPAVDCGESCSRGCASGSACNVDRDCGSLRCVDASCAAPSCDDEVQNQDESALDCGGSCASRCAAGQTCTRDSDCQDGLFCPPSTGSCTDESCQDGTRTGGEVLVDCGGGECPGCPTGSPCNDDRDCSSGVCVSSECVEPSCTDGLTSGDESGVDCGGSDTSCDRCPDGAPCRVATDCESLTCEDGICTSCSDGRRNGSETGTDCGGPDAECARCTAGSGCSIDDDCESDECTGGECVIPRCDDGDRNGGETDIDCGGGNACPRCGPGDSCVLNSDCSNQSCDDGACASCGDGSLNGGESDVDCGGSDPSCDRCAPGESCRVDGDCASGACSGGVCCGGSQGDCTRCAERLSATVNCDFPLEGTDPTGVAYCNAFLACLINSPARCPTRNAPGCSGDDQVNDACPHNNFGGNAGTGLTRANQVLQNAGCQL